MSFSKLALVHMMALLVIGCAAQSGVKPTDLSAIKVGASRTEVQAVLGEPVGQEKTEYGLADAYEYDRGTDPAFPRSYRGCVGACAMAYLLILPASVFAHNSIVSEQKGRIFVLYDEKGRVKKFHKNPAWAVEQKIMRENLKKAQAGDAQAQYFYANGSTDPATKLKWFCRAAHNGIDAAFYKLAKLYHDSLPQPERAPVLAYQYYLLGEAALPGAAPDGLKEPDLSQPMIDAQRAAAKNAATIWKPNPSSCPA